VFAPGSLMGGVAVGDIGVAFPRADRMVDFRWFDVMAPPLAASDLPRAPGCLRCGAPQRFGPVTERCGFCGEELPRPERGEFGARFRAAAASPEAAAAGSRRPFGGVPSLVPPVCLLLGGALLGRFALELRDALAAAA